MAQVDLEVNGRAYRLLCEDGQEGRLMSLADYVDRRLRQLTGGGKLGSDAHMLLMTCLVLADELAEARSGAATGATVSRADEAAMVEALDRITNRIEEVAVQLERA